MKYAQKGASTEMAPVPHGPRNSVAVDRGLSSSYDGLCGCAGSVTVVLALMVVVTSPASVSPDMVGEAMDWQGE